ncbi:MAG: PAS domain S-box protein [Rhizobiaceae bacterium]|nr:PAS domain S-box protein [Rhizobiaceae bacterium]
MASWSWARRVVFGLAAAWIAILAIYLFIALRADGAIPPADASAESLFMGTRADTLVDFGTIGAIDATTLPDILARMRPADGKMHSAGLQYYKGGWMWLTFEVPPLAEGQRSWVVTHEHSRIRSLRLVLVKDGVFIERDWQFDSPERKAGLSERTPTFNFDRAELEGARVLMGFTALGAMRPEVRVETARAYAGREMREIVQITLLSGGLFAMALALLIIGARLRENSVLAAAGLSFFTGHFIYAYKGLGTSALLYRWPNAAEIFLYAAQPAFPAFILFLILTYLQLPRTYPRYAAFLGIVAAILPFQGLLVTATALGAPIPFIVGNTEAVLVCIVLGLGTLIWLSLAGATQSIKARARLFLVCMTPIAVFGIARTWLYLSTETPPWALTFFNTYVDIAATMMLLGILVVLDIQRREAALKREALGNEARFRGYAEIATDSYFETDAEGRIGNTAGRVGRMIGLAEGIRLSDALAARADRDPNGVVARLAGAPAGAELRDAEVEVLADDGLRHWVAFSAAPHAPAEGETGLRGTIADVTERVERRASEARQSTLSALGQLAGGVAHEVNNLLHPMVNLARRVRDRYTQDEDARKLLDMVIVSGRTAGEIVAGVLNAFNPSREPGAVKPIETALAEALDIVRATIPSTVRVVERVETGTGAEVPVGEMLQIVSNVLSNSIRAMQGAGRIDIELRGAGPGAVEISFADDGPGMPEAIRRRATEPFVTGRANGTGLGLSIVASIAAKWGGTVDVQSSPGKGTRLVLTVPRAVAEAKRAAE